MLTVYTKNNCPFCDMAKSLIESKGVEYRTVNIEFETESREFLLEQGLRSVPQIFDDKTHLPGGYQGLAARDSDFWQKYQKPLDLGSL